MVARPAISVRPATDADIAACAALWDRVQRAAFAWDPETVYGRAAFESSMAGEVLTLAWADCRIAGLISVFRPDGYVHTLYVDLPWQGCGVGRQLLAAGLAGLAGSARLKCDIANVAAQRFYQRLGWREVARSGSRPNDWILYSRELAAT